MTRDRNAILRGTCPRHLSGSDFDAKDAAYGPLTIRRSQQPAAANMPASRAACNTGVRVGKRAGCWSGKPSITAMAGGDLDAQTLRLLWSIPQSHDAFVSIWHEGDGKIRKGDFRFGTYRAAWRRFCELVCQVQAEGRPRLRTIQVFTTWSGISPKAGSPYAENWPGDGLVDVLGMNGYSHVGSGPTLWGRP
ncbi:hypothetical protein [Actinomadura luteofluorescens]